MKPVAICRYAPHEGPGYFAAYLERRGLPWRLVKIDAGEPLPQAREIAGLAMMGGPMSVNDDLPWVEPMLALIRSSMSADVPVIGHCLGGQLLAKAMGAAVTRAPVKEIGWGEVDIADDGEAHRWGPAARFLSFHWHGETFAIPPGAVRIWSSAYCANQAFVAGCHLGMQCHVEMTPEMIDVWCETGAGEIEDSLGHSLAVQRPAQMREDLERRLDALHAVADRVYDRWSAGLRR